MNNPVSEAHPLLYHYTTAAGLQGIIESQQLWATSIAYLNDAEEHTGFFDRRLPYLLEKPTRDAIAEITKTADGKGIVNDMGGVDEAVQKLKRGLTTAIRSTTLKFNDPYIASFCSANLPDAQVNGLLSQWRGYGSDGGYAIIFETNIMHLLLERESKNFNYQTLLFGNVEYYDQDSNEKAAHKETLDNEKIIQDLARRFILTKDAKVLGPALNPITTLSCTHKHRGFNEEDEIRIVAIPTDNRFLGEMKKIGHAQPKKRIQYRAKNGVLIPYIALFEQEPNKDFIKLPIKKIIVGPHPDKLRRKEAIESLLEQRDIKAEVTVSDIPYLGH